MGKNSFIVYTEYSEQIELLNMEQRGALLTAMLAYQSGSDIPDMDGMTSMCFAFIKARMDRDAEAYAERCQKNAENAKKGGRPKKANGFDENQMVSEKTERFLEKPKKPDTDTDIDTDKEKSISNEIPKKKPVKHKHGEYQNVLLTDDELSKLKDEFPLEVDNQIENLSNYLASTGKVYKSHYATIRNWIRRDKEKPPNKITRFVKPETERGTDFDSLYYGMIAKGGST